MTRIGCWYRGKIIGSIRPSCATKTSVEVRACLHEDVPSGKCVDDGSDAQRLVDGRLTPVKRKPRGQREPDSQVIVFPFTAEQLAGGHLPHANWVLRCETCPHRRDPPPVVTDLYADLARAQQRISEYESAEDMPARERFLSDAAKR